MVKLWYYTSQEEKSKGTNKDRGEEEVRVIVQTKIIAKDSNTHEIKILLTTTHL